MFDCIENHSVQKICGIPVHSLPHESVLDEMHKNIVGPRERLYISITNTESMYHARRLPSHLRYIENARFSLCDGVGVVIGAWFQGKKVCRFNGPVLMYKACQYGASRGWRHFFCGGKEGVAEILSKKLSKKFPDMITAGTFFPPFRKMTQDELAEMVNKINGSKPDVLWVGLGLLKQEAWIEKFIEQINVPWIIGVGAAFDFHAGTARWAPKFVRSVGLEWLYRLFFEPRMIKRNIWSFIFLFEAIREGISGKRSSYSQRCF